MRPESENNLYPPLFLAKDARETRKLLAEGADPNFCTNMGRTALCFAHSPRQAEVLIRAGADINGNDMTSPLHHISDPDTMLFLISKGADVNKQNHFRETPLFRVKNRACAEILIEHGATIEVFDIFGMSPLHYASSKDVAEFLLQQGADVNQHTDKGPYPMESIPDLGILQCLLTHGGQIPFRKKGTLFDHDKSFAKIELYLQAGANPNMKNNWGRTILHGLDDPATFRLMVRQYGVGINRKDSLGRTPLFYVKNEEMLHCFLDCYISDRPAPWDDVPAEPPTAFEKLSFTEGNPRLVLQTEHSFEEISAMAAAEPRINFIIASGDRKLLYHIAEITRLLCEVPNLYLATGNLCNPFALERLIASGCRDKLLYGSMHPFLAPGEALAQVVLGDFDWETRCAIAGNNFRRLLGRAPVIPPELPAIKIPPIFIDSHGHTVEETTKTRFPAPESAADWKLWERKLDFFGITHFFFTPSETNMNSSLHPGREFRNCCCESGGRMRYFEGFDPRYADKCLANLEKSLPDPLCIGIKIHPAGHRTDADDPAYEAVFGIAEKYGKPIMTHSWGVSDYNPVQKHATPERFECHLKAHPDVPFVFGHTGGRPNGFPAAAEMIRKYPQCMGDFSGDLFFNGHIRHAVSEIGADRVMFGTDMYWIDPRCVMGMLLEIEELEDGDFLKIARLNAERFYLSRVR